MNSSEAHIRRIQGFAVQLSGKLLSIRVVSTEEGAAYNIEEDSASSSIQILILTRAHTTGTAAFSKAVEKPYTVEDV